MKRRGYLCVILALGTLLLAVGLSVSVWSVRRFRANEYAEFRDKSIQLAGVFARAAGAWIARGQLGVVDSMADVTLAGSGQYVWIQLEADILLDKRIEDPTIAALDLSVRSSLGEVAIGSSLRDGGLDVVYPLNLPAQAKVVAGAVRIGFSDSTASRVVRRQTLLVFSLTVGSWIAVLLVAILLARIIALRRRLVNEGSVSEPAGVIQAGAITIDTDKSTAWLGSTKLELTPKMFDLLAYLARHEGKTFSDADLLSALWADAPYAASNDVKQCIYMLRRRLRAAHPDPKRIIANVKGFGYKLVPPDETQVNTD